MAAPARRMRWYHFAPVLLAVAVTTIFGWSLDALWASMSGMAQYAVIACAGLVLVGAMLLTLRWTLRT